jgi:hypothetical protein
VAAAVNRLALVCTDRGTHPARTLGWLYDGAGGVVFTPWIPRQVYRQLRAALPNADDLRRIMPPMAYVRALCPTCNREHRVTRERAQQLYDGFITAGQTRHDISAA